MKERAQGPSARRMIPLVLVCGLALICADAFARPRNLQIYQKSLIFAMRQDHGLGLSSELADRYAAAMAKRKGVAQDRYAWMFQTLRPEDRSALFNDAIETIDEVTSLNPTRFAAFQKAFTFAYVEQRLDFLPARQLAKRASLADHLGNDRYRWAVAQMDFSPKFPEITGIQFNAAMELYEQVHRLNADDFEHYRQPFEAAFNNSNMAIDLAEEFAQRVSASMHAHPQLHFVIYQAALDAMDPVTSADVDRTVRLAESADGVSEQNYQNRVTTVKQLPKRPPGHVLDSDCYHNSLEASVPLPNIQDFVKERDAIMAVNATRQFRYPKYFSKNARVEMTAASEAFSFPEKYLACVYETESAFHADRVSAEDARNISQLVNVSIRKISTIVNRPEQRLPANEGELKARWDYYWKLIPKHDRGSRRRISLADLRRNLAVGIGAGALWSRFYADQYFGPNIGDLGDNDLIMLSGTYILGIGGLESRCHESGLEGCLSRLRRLTQYEQRHGIPCNESGACQALDYMTKIRACLRN